MIGLRKPREALGWWIFGACIFMYALSGACAILSAEPGTAWPDLVFDPPVDALIGIGVGGIVPLHKLELWSLITANYLHSDIFHIGLNMLSLLEILPIVVQQFGRTRTFAIYTLAGLASSLASAGYGELYSLGASGCIFGLFGAQVAYALRVGGEAGWAPVKENIVWVLLTLVVGLAYPEAISNAGHVGGFVGGLLAGLALGAGNPQWRPALSNRLYQASLAVTVIAIAVGTGSGAWTTYLATNNRAAYTKMIDDRRYTELDERVAQSPDDDSLAYERGLQHYQKAEWQAALDDFERAVAVNPIPDHQIARADTLYVMKRYAEAAEAYSDTLDAAPENIKAHYYRGQSFQMLGKQEQARIDFRAARDMEASTADDYVNRGAASQMLEEWDDAIADYDIALEKDPSVVSLYIDRANSHIGKRDYKAAIPDLDEAIRRAPNDPASYGLRALALYAAGEWARALSDYDIAIKANPEEASLYVNRGGVRANLGDFPGAITDYNEALKRAPENYTAYGLRGVAYSETNQYDKAIADYSLLIAKGTPDANLWNARAWALYKAGRQAEALPDVEKALAMMPGYAAALDTRAHIFEAMGERDKAIEDYRAALAKDPTIEVSKDGLRRLGAM